MKKNKEKEVHMSESHAIILGGGFAGLLAAATVSKHFTKVTIVELDNDIDKPTPRNGAPQGHQAHVLIHAGVPLIREMFPGIKWNDWESGIQGGCYTEMISGVFAGQRHHPFKSSLEIAICDRAKFEYSIRKEVEKIANVQTMKGFRFEDYIFDAENKRVQGVIASSERIMGDLIIDCTGRATRTPALLKKYGYSDVTELKVGINLQYSAQIFEYDPNQKLPWQLYFRMEKAPSLQNFISHAFGKNTVVMNTQEIGGNFVVKDENSFMEYIKKVVDKPVYEFIVKYGKPISELKTFAIPKSFFRRYDLLPSWPKGLVVLGDAIAVFNPKYGQGMSLAALEVKTLEKYLSKENFEQSFQKAIAKDLISPYWDFMAGADLMLPTIEGDHPKGLKFLQWYAKNLLEVAAEDQYILEQFCRVASLEAKPYILFKPNVVFKVLKHAFKRPSA